MTGKSGNQHLGQITRPHFNLPSYGIVLGDYRFESNYCMSYHIHEVFEISYAFEGKGTVVFEGHAFDIQKGDILLCNSDFAHRITVDARHPMGYYVLNFDPLLLKEHHAKFMQKLFSPQHVSDFVYRQIEPYSSDILSSLRRILYEQTNQHIGYEVKIMSSFLSTLVSLARMKDRVKNLSQEREDVDSHRLSLVQEFLHHNYYKPLCLEDVASLLDVGPRQCSNLLNKWFGSNFVELLTAIRMNEAKKMLSDSRKSINFIAHVVGYEDVSHFIRTFKRYEEMTPNEFRRRTLSLREGAGGSSA